MAGAEGGVGVYKKPEGLVARRFSHRANAVNFEWLNPNGYANMWFAFKFVYI